MSDFLDTNIEFLKGVGPQRAKLLKQELGISTFGDLINYFPFRYEDRSQFHSIKDIPNIEGSVQIKGVITSVSIQGPPRKQRLVAILSDSTGHVELVWFKGAKWMTGRVKAGVQYIAYGKANEFQGKYSVGHPELEPITSANQNGFESLLPVYSTTEILKKRYVDSKALAKMTFELIVYKNLEIPETLDPDILNIQSLIGKKEALSKIHYPKNIGDLEAASHRLKFEELFYIQLKLFQNKDLNKEKIRGIPLTKSHLVSDFYENYMPFDLTNAQKRVIKEVYSDLQSGHQMNRLLQGDVGSGKTITAYICMLIAIGSDFQTTVMAPTEILANQHYSSLRDYSEKLGLRIGLVTGSTSKKNRKLILDDLNTGAIDILVGTHALLEEDVQFQKLGLVVIDEQHRFGVAQRAKLWQKNKHAFPHILVMTATPIPRTLAMTLYGDLEVSIIDELPSGRKPIKTTHLQDSQRLKLFGFMDRQIQEGRQVYLVYPLIEESEKLDYKDLMDGYEAISRAFPQYNLSILHGRMKSKDKEFEMNRFVNGETQIMVATTVIEVGVNVPNASVMVIENSERFGLSQLHQLRGRVGRGSDQSYCILMTGDKLSNEARERVKCMVESNDGFVIAEKDLEIRGPGDLLGTQQSGILDLKIADLSTDSDLLKEARILAEKIVSSDPKLEKAEHRLICQKLKSKSQSIISWGTIS